MRQLFWISLAGAAGTAVRYAVTLFVAQRLGAAFPYGTLFVNLFGCFAMSALVQVAVAAGWPAELRAIVTIGFLGGLTTYSSFNYETLRLLEDGASITALVNMAATTIGGLAAGWLGLIAGKYVAT